MTPDAYVRFSSDGVYLVSLREDMANAETFDTLAELESWLRRNTNTPYEQRFPGLN